MKVRNAIFAKLSETNKNSIEFWEDNGDLRHLCAIPPGKNRLDILTSDNYYYNFKGNPRKIRGEKIIIRIGEETNEIEYCRK